MSKVKRLVSNYARHIEVPWRDDAAAAQRVIFCVYPETEELRLRARIEEFELATTKAGHRWLLFDLTDTFANWMASLKYAKSYYRDPTLLKTLLPTYQVFLVEKIQALLDETQATDQDVGHVKQDFARESARPRRGYAKSIPASCPGCCHSNGTQGHFCICSAPYVKDRSRSYSVGR
jgi:hypothetical protein